MIELPSLKTRANFAVRQAIKQEKLHYQPCEICGALQTVAHHDDYAKPLEVRFLCYAHHAEYHRDRAKRILGRNPKLPAGWVTVSDAPHIFNFSPIWFARHVGLFRTTEFRGNGPRGKVIRGVSIRSIQAWLEAGDEYLDPRNVIRSWPLIADRYRWTRKLGLPPGRLLEAERAGQIVPIGYTKSSAKIGIYRRDQMIRFLGLFTKELASS